eukprot:g1333.t1
MVLQLLVILALLVARSLGGLPSGPLLVGYATDRCLSQPHRIDRAVAHGVNVIIWSFAHLELKVAGGRLSVRPTFDVAQVLAARQRLAASGATVAHLVAFGGWNGPHPSTTASGLDWFECWRAWNAGNGSPFDGVDWDLEGHNDPQSPTMRFTPALVALVADFSRAAHAAGFAVALAPPESYLDAASSAFSLALNHTPAADPGHFPEPSKVATFPYAGRNAYAAILRRAGTECFALVSVQLYEGYSRACHAITRRAVPAPVYIAAAARRLTAGFNVRFKANVAPTRIVVPSHKLALGFANGWADGDKFLRVAPADIAAAFAGLADHERPRGVMFWVIDEEGEAERKAEGEGRQGGERHFFARDLTRAFRDAGLAAPAGPEVMDVAPSDEEL